MVLKIDKQTASQEEGATSESFDPPLSKKKKSDVHSEEQAAATAPAEVEAQAPSYCAGCKISSKDAQGALLLFDDPEEDGKEERGEEKRYVWIVCNFLISYLYW